VLALRAALASHRDVVLQAPTGAGKSTLVPLALLEEAFVAGRRIIMLEPRRLAARAVAARMAALRAEAVGATVGYRMRLDTRVSAATRIEVLTEGVLTRLLQEDPALDGVACLILDEYHERSVQADLGLALALDARRELGTPLRLLVMSATLEAERVAALLADAAVVSVPGRAYPVELRYLGPTLPRLPQRTGREGGDSLERSMARAIQRALEETSGDVLAFLPGAGEINRLRAELAGTAPTAAARSAAVALGAHVQLMPLYGELGTEAQDAALSPAAPGMRKVVLATNLAETSVTIPGVTAVVDCGLARRARFDPVSGMSRLELGRISRAASEQRAGRAGRIGPGVCYRLWSEGAQQQLAATTPAEILEADLAGVALELARWGVADAARLSWLDAPPPAALAQARELLTRLGALDAAGRLSTLGASMARLPVHPRLSRMLLAGRALGALPLAAQLAALLSERDLLRGAGGRGSDAAGGGHERDPDLRTRLDLLAGSRTPAVDRVRRAASALERAARQLPLPPGATPSAADTTLQDLTEPYRPGALLALGFPDRIGQRRDAAESRGTSGPHGSAAGRYLLTNGRGAAFGAASLAREPWIVAVELDDREREARIDLAAPLTQSALEDLFAAQIETEERFEWDAAAEALVSQRVRRLGALPLEQRSLPVAHDQRAVPAMLEVLQQLGITALPWDEQSRGLQARLQFVQALGRHELGEWPASDDASLMASLAHWLAPYLDGVTRRAALARVPLGAALLARLTSAQQRALEVLAPRTLVVPSGAAIAIEYRGEHAPRLSVRLQELFGLADAPRVGGGAVPVTLELLSPARRPVQITRDLAGFWRGSYAQVRRDLRGRYPRHDWPENPLEARPTRGVRRR
jgi:ATP-dependent helicase HrpB